MATASAISRQVGAAVRARREAADVSQSTFSRRMEIAQSRLSDLESGKQEWTADHIDRAARALGIHPAALLRDQGEAPDQVEVMRETIDALRALLGLAQISIRATLDDVMDFTEHVHEPDRRMTILGSIAPDVSVLLAPQISSAAPSVRPGTPEGSTDSPGAAIATRRRKRATTRPGEEEP